MVKINDTYYVQVEDKNLTLQRINGIDKRTGKPKYSIIGYFSNWPALFEKLKNLLVVKSQPGRRDFFVSVKGNIQ